ncbi:MAG TPA: nuclear transport factor 2 family protein [Bryobacteraceae bacterium]|jgi:ketosteroid isomerase-like protein|nr:nuclear transport factor 2 family protein [Bryobacteraceae bacterium]
MCDQQNTGTPGETFEVFVSAINRHDVDALTALMNPEHLFVDSLGNRIEGSTRMQIGWRGYFSICPDYWIHIDTKASIHGAVIATGEAGGSIDDIPWRTPAAWKAEIRDGKVLEWRVFADNKPVYEILAARKP